MRYSLHLLLAVSGVSFPCVAGMIVFSNLAGPGGLYGPDGVGIGHTPAFSPTSLQFLTYATPFTVQSDSLLSMIEVPIGVISGPNQIGAVLFADAGGAPGAPIETFVLTNPPFKASADFRLPRSTHRFVRCFFRVSGTGSRQPVAESHSEPGR